MELKQIYYFLSLYEEGSVTAAAARMHIVQPALSAQIKNLEQEIGGLLFERHRKGMTPTALGHDVYRLYKPIVQAHELAMRRVKVHPGELSGELVLGTITSIAEGVLPAVVAEFGRQHPKVRVRVKTANLLEGLSAGKLDFAIMDAPPGTLALNVQILIEDEIVIAGNREVLQTLDGTLEGLQACAVVLTGADHGLRAVVDDFLHQYRVPIQPGLELNSLGAIKLLLAETAYVSLLPRLALRHAPPAVAGLSLRDRRMYRRVACVTHPMRPLGPAAQRFVEMLHDEVHHGATAPPS